MPETFLSRQVGAAPSVWAVGALLQALSDTLGARFNPVAVQGEISGFSRAASGHCYFSLKDEAGQLRCAMFRRSADLLSFDPANGQRVQVQGRIDIYGPRGDLQLIVESMQTVGQGALFEQFLRLKARLETEGLFSADRKRTLPAYPRSIGVVTSLGAAALRDVVTTLSRRVPHIPVFIYPTSVQGASAPREVVQALDCAYERFQARGEGDVVLLVRGGGSLEDLWSFNDESVVRAVARAPMPVVCGVGHETDFTLADFAADLRAPTPTAAAELCAPMQQVLLDRLQNLERRMGEGVWRGMDQRAQDLDRLTQRLGRPSHRVKEGSIRLTALQHRMASAVSMRCQASLHQMQQLSERLAQGLRRGVERQEQRLSRGEVALARLDPKVVLRRGYAYLSDTKGATLSGVAQLHAGQAVRATLMDGSVDMTVDRTLPNP